MSITTTLPGEIGEVASEGVGDIVDRIIGRDNPATYIEGDSPIDWTVLGEAGWDIVGVGEDEDSADLRDLVEIAMRWGTRLVALPLLPTMLIKRHSEAAAEHDGPVTLSIPTSTSTEGWGVVPFGQHEGIVVLQDLETQNLIPMPDGEPSSFDPVLRTVTVPMVSTISVALARELQAVWAGEAAGVARRAVADGVAFVKEREQFGRPIGSFQAVKHHLANAHIQAEQAETAAIWASLEPERAAAVSAHGIRAALRAVELVVQVHGGLGFTWEMGLHFSLRHLQRLRELVAGLDRA